MLYNEIMEGIMEDAGYERKKFETLQKVKDMMLYAYPALNQFPKSEKFAMVADIKRNMDEMLELCIEVKKKYQNKTTLRNLDIANAKLMAYIQMAQQLKFLPMKKYEVWSEMLVEIGKMIGGLIKAVNRSS